MWYFPLQLRPRNLLSLDSAWQFVTLKLLFYQYIINNKQYIQRGAYLKLNFCSKKLFYSLDLALYRHWTLFDSLLHSLVTASSFRVWTNMGMKKLHQFLAEMGIPLTQCKQRYCIVLFNRITLLITPLQGHGFGHIRRNAL